MSFIHSNSNECAKPQLDLFSLPATQLSIEGSDTLYCSPISSLENQVPIEFIIPESEEHYIDPSETYLYVNVRVLTQNNEELEEDDTVTTVNNFLYSLFGDVSVYINSKLLTPPTGNFAYSSYIENLLNTNQIGKENYFNSIVWSKDTAGLMNDLRTIGSLVRRGRILRSRNCSMMGRIKSDIFGQEKFIPNSVPIKIVFTRTPAHFSLMAPENSNYNISITKAELHVKRVRINTSILLAQNKLLGDHTAKFPFTRSEVKTFTVQAGGTSFEQKIVSGQEPVRIVMGLVRNNAGNAINLNPYDFNHYNLNYLSLTRNGVPINTRPLQPNFENGDTVESYLNLFRYASTSVEGFGFNFADYNAGGYVLFCFDLTSDNSAASHQWSLRRQSTIEVFLRFSAPIPFPLNLMMYAEYQNLIEIDKDRKVTVDY
jgi:hypothetical protein